MADAKSKDRFTISRIMQNMISQYSLKDLETVERSMTEFIAQSLEQDKRVEVRGFGSFSLRKRSSCIGRNPSSGERIELKARHSIYFRPGKLLRQSVHESRTSATE